MQQLNLDLNKPTLQQLQNYYQYLQYRVDWCYNMSEGEAYRKGMASYYTAVALASEHSLYQDLFNQWKEYYFCKMQGKCVTIPKFPEESDYEDL